MLLLNRLIPFIIAGVLIVIAAFSLIILAYLFLIGSIIGVILFGINWVRAKWMTSKTTIPPKQPSGRIIDSDDWRKL